MVRLHQPINSCLPFSYYRDRDSDKDSDISASPANMEPDPFTPKDGYGQVIYAFFPDMPKIIRLDEHRVLKSAITNSTETEAMKFVAANTTIPVPKVYKTI
ncbi:uncharacterized protein BDCG_16503 [Blastomyces dermatitidis ER-3]|uniref:Uncharacterized protein n=1 Tax=Ajellomyces dermatitidis (strain ER-3 / ATCC MYA-2586) TaxID=559297 RepID=A0ABX2VSK0_AJEDR|nr:uncharacterized protein BDCG_16503 [Blastomyces dermatitidis ER-3]OAT00190.1 hypothetical protein BDCG_16503 [Blastomyces dermatitidis ER-3]